MIAILRGPAPDPRIAALTGSTLVELLDLAVARSPERTALVLHGADPAERWSYRELGARSRSAAVALAGAGVRHGDRVVTWGPASPWLVAAMFGAWRLGAVVVPLDLRMAAGLAARIAGRTEPRLVLAGADQAAEAGALGVAVLGIDAASLDAREAAAAGIVDPRPVVAEDLAEIVFTSGTTADPKGVALTHGQLIHHARAIAQTGMGREPDRALGVIPLSHLYGQVVPLFLGLVSGSTLVLCRALTPAAIGAALRAERITAVTAVPGLARLLLEGIDAEARRAGRTASLRRARRVAAWLPMRLRRRLFRPVHRALGGELAVITSGGALLPPELQAAWEHMGVRVVQGYGATECAAITGHSREHRRPGTVGRVLAGTEVAFGPDGELLVRSPGVMTGYWNAPEATAEVLGPDGWLHTGDAAAVGPDGELRILGRTRDRIALPNGLKVYPEDVEAALVATGAIRAAVVAETTPGRLAAALLPVDPATPDEALGAAVRAANASLAPHQRVAAWRRWPDPDLPRTHTLKVRRDPVAQWLRSALGASGGAVDPSAAATASRVPRLRGWPRPREGRERRAAGRRSILLRGGRAAPEPAGDPLAVLCRLVAEVAGGADGAGGAGGAGSASGSGASDGAVQAVEPGTALGDLAFDSLQRVTLALRIDEELGVAIGDDAVAGSVDVRALLRAVDDARGRPVRRVGGGWALAAPARVARRLLDASITPLVVDLVARPRVLGLEHLAGLEGPFLVCPNHTSHLDVPVVRRVLPRRIREPLAVAAAADVFFTRRSAGALVGLAFGAVPFGRAGDVRASLERVATLLAEGRPVLLFPEGTRALDGRLGPMRDGVGLLAMVAGVPIVPVHLDGAFAILPKGRRMPRRRRGARVTVRIGAPLRFPAGTNPHAVARRVGAAIEALATEAAS